MEVTFGTSVLLLVWIASLSHSVRRNQLLGVVQFTALGTEPLAVRFTVEIATQAAVLVLVEPRWEDGHVTAAVVHEQSRSRWGDDVNRSLVPHSVEQVKLVHCSITSPNELLYDVKLFTAFGQRVSVGMSVHFKLISSNCELLPPSCLVGDHFNRMPSNLHFHSLFKSFLFDLFSYYLIQYLLTDKHRQSFSQTLQTGGSSHSQLWQVNSRVKRCC